jgi:DGQHR domain-containing protein
MHLEFSCVEVKQGEQARLYLGALRFSVLWPLCTVKPREPRRDDPLYSERAITVSQTPQRHVNPKRLEEIADFVSRRLDTRPNSRKEVVFPGTVILGLLVDVEEYERLPEHPTPTAAILCRNPQIVELKIWLPPAESTLFVIDGQHRLKGLHRLEERISERVAQLHSPQPEREQLREITSAREKLSRLRDFEIPISLLVDFDLAEQAMVFADVNFNQKTVSRSYYWDIFGAFESDNVSTISFTHELVLHLNNADKSPLKGMIKILGTGPGLISQAFLGVRLVLLIDPEHSKAVFRHFFLRRQKGDVTASRQIAAIIRNFFQAVKAELPYAWPTLHEGRYSAYHYRFILCKSMVMSGLIAILGEIYKLALLDFAFDAEAEVAASEVFSPEFFRLFLTEIDLEGRKQPARSIFARDSDWGIGGSTKVERRIYETLRANVFSSYSTVVERNEGIYGRAVERFRGRRQAIDILRASPNEEAFWTRTDAQWIDLSGLNTVVSK